MINAHPILGVGINTFGNEMKRYDTTGVAYYFPQPVHNVYLLMASETGLVGLGIFLLLFLTALREGLQNVKSQDRFISVLSIGILGGMVVLATSNIFDVHLRTDVLYSLFWLLIGLIAAINRMVAQEVTFSQATPQEN
jgi:O-antigen ligase